LALPHRQDAELRNQCTAEAVSYVSGRGVPVSGDSTSRGWQEDASRIVEYAEACERHIVENFRRQNETATNDFYARRAEHYQEMVDHLRSMAGSDA
jgi:hypothetical protein